MSLVNMGKMPLPLLVAGVFSILLVTVGLLMLVGRKRRGVAGFLTAVSGAGIAFLIAVVSHRFLDMTEIIIAFAVGAIGGLSLGYWVPLKQSKRLVSIFVCLISLSVLAMTVAINFNPVSLGLLAEVDEELKLVSQILSGVAMGLGAMVFTGTSMLALCGAGECTSGHVKCWLLLLLLLFCGSGIGLYVMAGPGMILWFMMLVGAVPCALLIYHGQRRQASNAISWLTICAAYSVLCIGFLMQNAIILIATVIVIILASLRVDDLSPKHIEPKIS